MITYEVAVSGLAFVLSVIILPTVFASGAFFDKTMGTRLAAAGMVLGLVPIFVAPSLLSGIVCGTLIGVHGLVFLISLGGE